MGRVAVLLAAMVATLVFIGGAALADPDGGSPAGPELKVDHDLEGNPYVAGELLVTYEEQVSARFANAANEEAGADVETELPQIDAAALSFPDVKQKGDRKAREEALKGKKQDLEADPNVESVSYNYLLQAQTNDEYYVDQWGIPKIRAPQAWPSSMGLNVQIAIVDDGLENNHPDLAGGVIFEHDYVEDDAVAQPTDSHGTHVAGIAAARTNNGIGVAGTAPRAQLMDYKVVGPSGATFADMAQAITDAADAGADVINISVGASVGAPVLENAVNYAWNKGAVLTASAGNSFEAGNPPNFPSGYAKVIAVGAITKANTRSNFSRVGPDVDVVAPGGSTAPGAPEAGNILSTVPDFFGLCASIPAWCYEFKAGTSMASPHVAGIAALLKSQGLSKTQIRQRIEGWVTDLGPTGRDNEYGHGLVNAQAAVSGPAPAPTVTKTLPADRAINVGTATNVTTFFSKPMLASTINTNTVFLTRAGTRVPAKVTYDAANKRAILNPNTNLQPGATYIATVTPEARNQVNIPLDQNPAAAGNQAKTWRFTVKR